MMRRLFPVLVTALLALSCGQEDPGDLPMAVAHRGCWLKEGDEFYINENCPAGVWMARQYGYPAIECDVKYTKDSVMVLMHDGTINRTMRNAADYSVIEAPVRVSDCSFEELRTRYVLASTDPALRTPIPTLREQLEACREAGIIPMLHSAVVESYELAHEILGDSFIAFDANESAVSRARDYSSCLILLDPGKDDAPATIQRLGKMGGACGMSTMNYKMLDAAYIQAVKDAGFEVQASIFPAPHEQRALTDGVTIELSDFYWHQTEGRKPIVSYHTKGLALEEGETFDWTEKAPEFAAVTLELDFSGELEISFCGRTYTLRHDEAGTAESFGTRLYKTPSELTLKALSATRIKSLKVKLYDCQDESVTRIWDQGYSAFPSIVRYKDAWYVSFREGVSHIFDENGIAAGKTRILRSADFKNWKSMALLEKEGYDLRDPKLSVTPDGRLMVIQGGSVYVDKKLVKRIPQVSFSSDGRSFSDPQPVDYPIPDGYAWFWRMTWHEGTGYTVSYGEADDNRLELIQTTDGQHFEKITDIALDGFPNETTVRFLPDGKMVMLVRREKEDKRAFLGISEAPFTDWRFTPLAFQIGGPEMAVLPDGSLIIGGRAYFENGATRTCLWKGNTQGDFELWRILPSGGDNSYPGFLTEDGELKVVYYSSHELHFPDGRPRAGIYLTRIPLQ